MSVTVVVDKRTSCIPTHLRPRLNQTCLLCHIGKGSIAVIAVQSVLPVVRHKQIVIAVVVIVPNTAGLPPTRLMFQTRARSYVSERSIPIILEQMASWLLSRWEPLQSPSVHEKQIKPAVIVVVVKSQPTASGLQ